ncbi:MAG: autotransporter-associated beta strand repeat-containing protein, partial [Pseudomonadota bacterium]
MIALMAYTLIFPVHLFALPQGEQVVAGQVGVVRPDAVNMQIHQATDKAIINWQQFSIAQPEHVQFIQPGANAISLNRVVGGDPSLIYGQLSANGGVWVINPNGVLVGATGTVNVFNFLASTLDIANDDFLSGNYQFTQSLNETLSAIVNQGTITAAAGGSVSLLAPGIENTGTITATLGSVNLGAGEQMTLSFAGSDGISFAVDKEVMGQVIGPDGQPLENSILNTGTISADGGQVVLSGRTAFDAVKSVVNNQGVIEAKTIEDKNGVIRLQGNDQGIVYNSGTLDVSGDDAGETGGTVEVTGEKVGLVHYSQIKASGSSGGGKVFIGGGFQGKNPAIKNGKITYVGKDATIEADAVDEGDGGEVIVWADEVTQYNGDISARGGSVDGDGGFVEVSGKENLAFRGTVDTTAAAGQTGTLLLDPAVLTIQGGVTNTGGGVGTDDDLGGTPNIGFDENPDLTTTITEQGLEDLATNIELEASTQINTTGTFDYGPDPVGTLTIASGNNLVFRTRNRTANGDNTDPGSAGIDLSAINIVLQGSGAMGISSGYGDSSLNGDITAPITLGGLTTAGGGIGINSNSTVTLSGNVTTNGGGLTITASGDISQGGNVNTGVGTVSLNAGANQILLHTGANNVMGDITITGSPTAVQINEVGDITQGAAWNLGTAPLTVGASGGAVVLNTSGNVFGDVIVTQSTGIQLTENDSVNGITDGASGWSATGTITLIDESASGGITVDGGLSAGVTGLSITTNGSFAIDAVNSPTLASLSIAVDPSTTGTQTYALSNFGGSLSLDLTDSSDAMVLGSITVPGDLSIETQSGGITIAPSSAITWGASSTATLTAAADISLTNGTFTAASGTLDLVIGQSSGGTLGTTGGVVTGVGTVNASGGSSADIFNIAISGFDSLTGGGGGDNFNLAGVSLAGGITGGGADTISLTTGTGTVSGAVTLGGNTTISVDGTQLTLSGVISESGGNYGITKNGAGTLGLTNTANTFSGAVAIDAGKLSVAALANIGAQSSLGTGATTPGITIGGTGAGTLSYTGNTASTNRAITLGNDGTILVTTSGQTLTLTGGADNAGNLLTVGGAGNTSFTTAKITGAGGLTKSDAGTLTLGFANDYTGATSISGGVVKVQNATSLGTTGTGTTLTAGAIAIDGSNLSIAEALSLQGDGISSGGALVNLANVNTLSGGITLTGATQINSNAGQLRLSEITGTGNQLTVSGSGITQVLAGLNTGAGGSLVKSGTGELWMQSASDYEGVTNVNSGSLYLTNNASLGTTAGNTVVSSGATVAISASGLTVAEPITIEGSGVFSAGALRNISGNNALTGGITLTGATKIDSNGGTLTISTGNITGAGQALTVIGAGNTTISSVLGTTSGTLTKQGTGTLTLSGTNTYTGLTTVSAGTLAVADNAGLGGTGAGTTVASGATLAIDGSGLSIAEDFGVQGTGVSSGGAIRNLGNNNSITGDIVLEGSSKIGVDGGTLTLGTIDGGYSLNIATNAGGIVLGAVGGTPLTDLTITGATAALSSVTTSGAQDYTGVTTTTLTGTLTVNTAGAGVSAGATELAAGGGTITLTGTNALNDVTLGTVNGAQALNITAGGGDVSLGIIGGSTAVTTLTVASNTAALMATKTTGAVDVTAGTTGNTIDIDGLVQTTGAGGTVDLSGNTTLSAGITTNNENITLTGNVIVDNTAALNTNTGVGNILITGTVDGSAATTSDDLTLSAGSGNVTINGDVGGTTPLNSLIISSAAVASLQDVSAANFTVTAGSFTTTGTLTGTDIVFTNPGSLGTSVSPISIAATTLSISGGTGSAYFTTTGSLDLLGINVGGNTLSLISGGAFTNATDQTVTAGTLTLSAASGIGSAANPLLTAVSTLNLTNTTGDINITNTGGLTLAGFSNGGSGSTTIRTNSPLTIAVDMIQAGTIDLTAAESAAFDDNLTVNAGIEVRSTGGNVLLKAGDNLYLTTGTGADNTKVDTTGGTGTLLLSAGFGDTDGLGTLLIGDYAPITSSNTTSAAITLQGIDLNINTTGNTSITATGSGGGILLYTAQGTQTMAIGGTGAQYSVSDSELVRLTNYDVLTIGQSSTQSGNITIETVSAPVTDGNIIVNADNGSGGIILNDGGSATALATGGAGTITLAAGTGGIGAASATNSNAELSSAGTISMTSAGDIGSSTHRIQFVDGQTGVSATASTAGNDIYVNGLGALTLGAVSTNGGTLDISGAGAIGQSGVFSGTGSNLTMNGSGNLTLSQANTFTGTTTISAGTVTLGAADTLAATSSVAVNGGSLAIGGNSESVAAVSLTGGSITGSGGTLTSASAFDVQAGSVSAILAGGVALNKTTTGAATLSGANTYTGLTTVSAGTLTVSNAAGLGTTAAGTSVSSGATLDINGVTVGAEALTLNGTLTGTGTAAYGGVVTLASTNSIGGAGTLTLSGQVTGTGPLTKVDAGTLVLSGAGNNWSGATAVNAGTLQLGAADVITNGSAVTVAGGATFDLNDNSETVGSIAGAGAITFGAVGGTLTAGGDNTSTTFSGVISEAGGLTKAGSGTLTLSGANSYAGATAV